MRNVRNIEARHALRLDEGAGMQSLLYCHCDHGLRRGRCALHKVQVAHAALRQRGRLHGCGTNSVLMRYTNLSYPSVVAQCRPANAGAVQLRGRDVLLPEARPGTRPPLRRRGQDQIVLGDRQGLGAATPIQLIVGFDKNAHNKARHPLTATTWRRIFAFIAHYIYEVGQKWERAVAMTSEASLVVRSHFSRRSLLLSFSQRRPSPHYSPAGLRNHGRAGT